MSHGRPLSVLIVEDHAYLARGFARALEREAYEVFLASDSEDGLVQADAHQPDVVIADFRLPHGNGLDFMTRLRERAGLQRTGLVMVTGLPLDEDTQSDLRALGAHLRSKPISLEDFVAVVRDSLNGRAHA
jgi:DNA-binding response OmpR family regulator